MSFAVFQQLTRSTVIDACVVCPLTSPEATNLVVVKGDVLEVYDLQKKQGRLQFVCTCPLFGRPEALAAYRPKEGAAANLAIVLRRGTYLAALRFDHEFGSLHTCGQHLLAPATSSGDPAATAGGGGASSSGLSLGFKPQICVDPEERCLTVRAAPDHLLVFAIDSKESWRAEAGGAIVGGAAVAASNPHQFERLAVHEDPERGPGLRTPFDFGLRALRLHHLQDIKFLPGYRQPTVACAGHKQPGWGGRISEANLRTCSVSIVAIDLEKKDTSLVWVTHQLPHDVFNVIPLHPPVGGSLVLSKNAVFYVKEHGPAFCQKLNPNADVGDELKGLQMETKDEGKLGVLLTGCSVAVLNPTTLLFSLQPTGRLWLAHLVLSSRDTVTDIIWTSPATVTPAWDMLPMGDEHVFIAAASGGGVLLKLEPAKKKLPQAQQAKKRLRTEGKELSEEFKGLLELHELLQEKSRSIPSYKFAPADEFVTFGSIKSLQQWVRDVDPDKEQEEGKDNEQPLSGTERFICCSGAGARGAMYIFQRAVPLELLTEFDLPHGGQFSAVWTFRQAPEEPVVAGVKRSAEDDEDDAAVALMREAAPHRFVLISGTSRSMLLETTEEIEEIPKSPLDLSAPTLCAGSVLQDRVIVQVTPDKMSFMLAASPTEVAAAPAPLYFGEGAEAQEAWTAHICSPYVVVVFRDKKCRLYQLKRPAQGGEGASVEDLTSKLPEEVREEVLCASIHKQPGPGGRARYLLLVVNAARRGTMRAVDVRSSEVVFCTDHVADVPPVLRNAVGRKDVASLETDRLRALTDPCAAPHRTAGDPEDKRVADKSREVATGESILRAEFVHIDAQDVGPTLVLVVLGRPLLLYRAFSPAGSESAFPFHFAIQEHEMLSLVESTPSAAYRPVASFEHPGGTAGAVVVSPHAGVSALWLAAKRNQLHIHPLPGAQVRSFAPLHAACCERGFFAVSEGADAAQAAAAQIFVPAVLPGMPDGQDAFQLHGSVPHVRKVLGKTPQLMACKPESGVVAVAVSESVIASPEHGAGPSLEEDPLADDWSIIRNPPVEATAPPMGRNSERHELWLGTTNELAKIDDYRFSFDPEEQVLCMQWMTLPGFPLPSLVVGTGVNVGEDLTSRGRVLVFSTKGKDKGVIPPVYQRSLKWPVTVIAQHGPYLVHNEGFKLFFEKWENSNFSKLAFFDGSMCVTALSSIKNFLLMGDIRNGLDFVQWKEDPVTQNRTLRRLAKSPPSVKMAVLACEVIVHQKSLGIVALDHVGTAHLFQYSPHSDGREGDTLLRSCATFSMGSPCRAVLRLQADTGVQCLFAASAAGELVCIRPIDDQVYRTVTTLLGMLSTRLPFRCGLNPRALRSRDGPPALVAPRKNIEDANMLRVFAFLSGPLQTVVAEKMRLKVDNLMRVALPCANSQLASLRPLQPLPTAGATAAVQHHAALRDK
eukprot:TRINITY_DN111848_c0_g1_i1.p1 TRINITY_DN111848_c0_g1~~TRINITY_DN111848_c0_g1_i1.p1  ORF type:complete len:1443 (-),score=280.36 TRINITY_DN111848_c0_g1_i1:120-4448(-)